MAGGSSAVRGLIPKSTGGRVGLGLGAAGLVGGTMAMRSRRSSGSSIEMARQANPQKQYEWQMEGGASDSQAKSYVNSMYPDYNTSSLRM
jgi:hypothetical protein